MKADAWEARRRELERLAGVAGSPAVNFTAYDPFATNIGGGPDANKSAQGAWLESDSDALLLPRPAADSRSSATSSAGGSGQRGGGGKGRVGGRDGGTMGYDLGTASYFDETTEANVELRREWRRGLGPAGGAAVDAGCGKEGGD